MPDNYIEYPEIRDTPHSEVCERNDDMKLSRLCYGDLYVLGRLWIEAVKTGLLGSKWSLIPSVEAAKPPPPPQKPPLMKYKDLPIYQAPHYEYKDFVADQDKCPRANDKLAQESLYPYVRSFRKSITESCNEVGYELRCMKNDIYGALNKKTTNFISYMRCPKNLQLRQAMLALGGVTGYCVASSKGLPSKFFCSGLGVLAAGALCFPKETDEGFRTFTYYTGKTAIALYNYYCNKIYALRERVPCKTELPPPPQYVKPNVCPVKK